MAWTKNGRPDFGAAGPRRLLVGLIWGLLLLALDPMRGQGLIKGPSLAQFMLVWPVLVTPFVLLAGLGQMRPRTLAIWAGASAMLAALLAWHDITRQGQGLHEPSPLLVPMSAVFFFGLHQLVAAGDEARRWIAPYDRLFGQASRQAVQLVLSVAMTGLFWAVLGLGSALFGLIGVRAFGETIGQSWFAYPATTLVFALAVQIADVRTGLIDGLRVLGLNLLAWLGPLMTLLVLAFLLALPFTGLGPLWATKAATPILLAAAVVLIGLINAAYQDGLREPPPALPLRVSARVAGLLLIPLVALAAYATLLRVGQYGLTPDRVIALAVVVVTGLLALGYAAAAVLPGAWMKRLEIANIAGLILALAVLLALFTPIADPARLSVDSQVARLTRGLTPPDRFDYQFLRSRSERYGREALTVLKLRKDSIGELSRASDQPLTGGRNPPNMITFKAYPTGASLPADFLAQSWSPGGYETPECYSTCGAVVLDLDGDGQAEVVVKQTRPMTDLLVYRREARWTLVARSSSNQIVTEDAWAALEVGRATTVQAALRDVIAGDQRINFVPDRPSLAGVTPPPTR